MVEAKCCSNNSSSGDSKMTKSVKIGEVLVGPVRWVKGLSSQTHWSFVFGVVMVYGVSQGLGGSMGRVGLKYYMKDVQKVQPYAAQVYGGLASLPWTVKPIWGLLTDVLPLFGYHRRPYFVLSGVLLVGSMIILSTMDLQLVYALLALVTGSVGVAMADVTIDACIAQNSNSHPSLAADLQSLCALSSSLGALVGFSLSGLFVHLIGPQGVFGLVTVPAGLLVVVGVVLSEPHVPDFAYTEVNRKLVDVGKNMWRTFKSPAVWRPSLYMYFSLALSLDINEGLFYWYTDSKAGPAFSQETVGFAFSIGSIGSLLGAVLFQYALKEYPFRGLLLWTQLTYGAAGLLDLVLVLRLNQRVNVPDYWFMMMAEGVSVMVGRLKWMPLLVLSSRLCPRGIEGTFFALLMSVDNLGLLSSSWAGGLLLHLLGVTRTRFRNLPAAVLVRSLLRVSALGFLFLVDVSPTAPVVLAEGDDADIELSPLVPGSEHSN